MTTDTFYLSPEAREFWRLVSGLDLEPEPSLVEQGRRDHTDDSTRRVLGQVQTDRHGNRKGG